MSITNELSSEVAAALLTEGSTTGRENLLRMLLLIHSTLRDLPHDNRRRTLSGGRADATRQTYKSAASGKS